MCGDSVLFEEGSVMEETEKKDNVIEFKAPKKEVEESTPPPLGVHVTEGVGSKDTLA
jgi:hypothetical protein